MPVLNVVIWYQVKVAHKKTFKKRHYGSSHSVFLAYKNGREVVAWNEEKERRGKKLKRCTCPV